MYYFDLFGKTPNIFYEGKSKKSSIVGLVFSIIYIVIYLAYFIYKMVRLGKRLDLTLYDIYSYDQENTMQFTKENFLLIFALEDSNGPYKNEDIYIPEVYYVDNEGIKKTIETEKCKINKIETIHEDIYKDFDLENYYCLKTVNHQFNSYLNSFIIKINKGSAGNAATKIDESAFIINFLDIEVNPTYYGESVNYRNNFIYNNVYSGVGQDFYLEFQKVIVETDNNIIAFDNSRNIQKEEYLKFDKVSIMPAQSSSSNPDNTIVEAEIQLSDKILLQRRKYKQLFDSLSEIGGFMQFFYILFSIIVIPISNSLYEKSVINNLFSFDLSKKVIKFKNYKKEESGIKFSNNSNSNSNKIDEIVGDSKRNLNIDFMNKEKNLLKKANTKQKEENQITNSNNSNVINSKNDGFLSNSIINEIPMNKFLNYFTCCCNKERKILNNILLNEGMDLLAEKLDIINLFKKVCLVDKMDEKKNLESEYFEMTGQASEIMRNVLRI